MSPTPMRGDWGSRTPKEGGNGGEGEKRQVSVGSSILALPNPLSPTQVGPTPPTPFSSGLHVLGLHLNTHSLTICLGLSEDQWGFQGLAQQETAGKSLRRRPVGGGGAKWGEVRLGLGL